MGASLVNFALVYAPSTPTLKPGRDVNLYGNIGYRFDEKLSVTVYYDGFEFKQSRLEPVTRGASAGFVFQPASGMSVIGLKVEYRLR